jgi:hypothetical protein
MDDTQTASDTITMAALMRALQVALHEVGRHDPNALGLVLIALTVVGAVAYEVLRRREAARNGSAHR